MSRPLLFRWLFSGLALVLLAGGLYLLTQRLTRPRPLEIRLDGQPAPEIRIYVTGAVTKPGVYTLRDGDRVGDAVQAAGGAAPDADLERLNLAKRLHDEDQVTVPRVGEAPAAPVSLDANAGLSTAPTGVIDLNAATVAELDTLPGIGAAYAQRIVESRQRDGRFRSVEDLLERKLVPRATYDRIKDRVTVGR